MGDGVFCYDSPSRPSAFLRGCRAPYPMFNIDLHCHSNVSDGLLPPGEVVARAAANGVQALALTDHDAVAGLPVAQMAAEAAGIAFIQGVEISVTWGGQTVHVVGLRIDPKHAGLAAAEFWIDPALQSITVPNAWFGTISHREALRQIAEASLGQVYVDRNGVIRVEGPDFLLGALDNLTITSDNYFRKDTPVKWGELANRIEVETQPLQPVATAQEVFRSNAPVNIAAGQTLTLTVHYNEPPVIEAAASLSGAPAGATITATTFYAWGADVTVSSPTNAGTFTLIINGRPLRTMNRERVVAEDAASIRDHGLLRYKYPDTHLVQSRTQGQFIADTLLRLYRNPRRDLIMEWRGNPALLLGDRVNTRDSGQWLDYWTVKQELTYDGALRANLEGRAVR